MGMFDRGGSGPMDYLRNRISNWQAHPFQNIASTAFGAFVPGGGLAANALFDRYNNNQFNNSAQQLQDRSSDLSTLNTNYSMNSPLSNDRLSGSNPFSWDGPTGPNNGGGYGGVESVSGGGGGMSGGGMTSSGYGGPSMSGQQWQDRGGGYGNLMGQTMGVAPDQPSGFVNDILDSISAGPGLPGTQQGGLFSKGPEGRREGNTAGGFNGPMGVSQFSPGTTLYQGMDPNQMVMANGRRNMY